MKHILITKQYLSNLHTKCFCFIYVYEVAALCVKFCVM